MNIRIAVLAAVLAGAFLLGGCVAPAPQTVTFDDGIYTVKSHSMTLRQHLRLTRRTVDFNKNGFLQAQIEAVNLGRKDVQFQYRFRWLNEQKMVVPAATAIWKPISVASKSTEYFTSTAPTPECRDFYMEVRFVYDTTRW